jgi:hypothetical protein
MFTIQHHQPDQKRTISLRLIEWYVTDCVRYVVPNKVVSEYADNLNIYSKNVRPVSERKTTVHSMW